MDLSEYQPLVSIIIVNYNYHQFLAQSIDSALQQTYSNIEVILVDDGSTDSSAETISKYVDRLIILKKENGGQASAMNLGFAVSRGDPIIFLDADDFLFPSATRLSLNKTPALKTISKVHSPLLIADSAGSISTQKSPKQPLDAGDLKAHLLKYGPESYVCSPTSGNLWTRHFLSKVLPIPEKVYKTSADAYLFTLSPLFGEIVKLEQPIGAYRVHGSNAYWNSNIQVQNLRTDAHRYLSRVNTLHRFAKALNFSPKSTSWKLNNRYYLAKIVLIARLQNRTLSPRFFLACLRASLVAPIAYKKRLGWLIWFCAIWVVPKRFVQHVAKPFVKLKIRL